MGVYREGLVVLQLVPKTPSEAPSATRAAEAGDESFVLRAIDGDRDAFEVLYRRHASFAINLAVRLQGNRSDVEDLVHDAFLKAFQRLDELRDPAAFRPWLGSIVVSLLRTRIRRARWFSGLSSWFGSPRSFRQGHDPVDIESLASGAAGPDLRAELAQIYALLRLLPADERIAWTLRRVERHGLEAVAELTQCSLATVKRRIQRAQQFLDEHYVNADSTGRSEAPAPAFDASVDSGSVEAAPESAPVSRRAKRRSS